MSDDGPEWFAPKRYGYGSGLPIAWQGWLLLLGYLVIIFAASLLIPFSWIAYTSVIVSLTVLFCVVCARTTRGGWRWRSGEDE